MEPVSNTDYNQSGSPNQVPIWLDCDTGHDDAFAILLAATHPQAHLLGISTVFGNASLDHVTYNTRAVLKAIGREDVLVYPGASKPFSRDVAHATDIHGKTGLDGTTCLPTPTIAAKTDMTAVQAMYKALVATGQGRAWIVATGSMTNVALLLALYPALIDHIAGISIMGGAVGGGFAPPKPGQDDGDGKRIGNWTPWAEFNIYIDPESARSILSNPKIASKMIMMPLDVTHQFIATADIQSVLLRGSNQRSLERSGGSELRKLFVEILIFFAKTYADVFGLREGPPLHDPLAVAIILAPDLFTGKGAERFKIDVVIDGAHGDSLLIRSGPSQCGRTVLTPVKATDGQEGAFVPRTLNTSAVWKMIDHTLGLAEDRLRKLSP